MIPNNRTFWHVDHMHSDSDGNWPKPDDEKREQCDEADANLVSSLLGGWARDKNRHAPALDFDFPCELVESSTPGHFHLYMDKTMRWESYEKLLRVLGEVGLLEEGYVNASIARGQTFLRKPGVTK